MIGAERESVKVSFLLRLGIGQEDSMNVLLGPHPLHKLPR